MEQTANQSIQRNNRRIILGVMRNGGAVDVSALSQATGLSRMTVHKALEYYVEKGLVKAAGKAGAVGEMGKKPNLFRLNSGHRLLFSAQIFEASLLAAVTDLGAHILAQRHIPYSRDTDLHSILDVARHAFDEMGAELKAGPKVFAAVVLGTNGVTDAERGIIVTSPHFASWGNLVPVRDLLHERFPFQIQLYVDNWIRHQAYAEMKLGPARTCKRFMVIGTEPDGISAGLVEDGEPRHGGKGLAGEIAHMQVTIDSDEVCACGGRGCLEPAVSLVRLQERVRKAWRAQKKHPPSGCGTAEEMTYLDIFRLADEGDRLCREALDLAASYLAMGINNTVQVFEPELVVIQGEYALAGDFFLQRLRERFRGISLLQMDKGTQIMYSTLGQQGVIGAAHFAADRFFADVD